MHVILQELDDVTAWINRNANLRLLIENINGTHKEPGQRMLAYYYQVSALCNLPKEPEDLTEEVYEQYEEMGIDDVHSVYEECGLLNYLHQEIDEADRMLLALYHVANYMFTNAVLLAEKYYGSREAIDPLCIICLFGDTPPVKAYFLKKGESWFDIGARVAIKFSGDFIPLSMYRNIR